MLLLLELRPGLTPCRVSVFFLDYMLLLLRFRGRFTPFRFQSSAFSFGDTFSFLLLLGFGPAFIGFRSGFISFGLRPGFTLFRLADLIEAYVFLLSGGIDLRGSRVSYFRSHLGASCSRLSEQKKYTWHKKERHR